MALGEYQPSDRAPDTGAYEELNVFGRPTGRAAVVAKDEEFPAAARGFTWRWLSDHSPGELRRRAAEYRQMAQTARTATVMESLKNLAERFDALADRRELEERG
jgi:hypothetical protein